MSATDTTVTEVITNSSRSSRRTQRKAAVHAQDVMDRVLGKKKSAVSVMTTDMIIDKEDITNSPIESNKSTKTKDPRVKRTSQRKKKVYCLCKSSDDSRAMIQCDTCKNWYHLDCVTLSQEESEKIDVYSCPICEQKSATIIDDTDENKKSPSLKRKVNQTKDEEHSEYSGNDDNDDEEEPGNHESEESDYYEDTTKMIEETEIKEIVNTKNDSETQIKPPPAKKRRSERPKPPVRRIIKKESEPKVDATSIVDTTRKKIIQAFCRILRPFYEQKGIDDPEKATEEKATAIEASVFKVCHSEISQVYKDKFRAISFNLKDKANTSLVQRIVDEDVTPEKLATASNEELANPELRNMAQEVRKQSLEGSVLKQVRGPIIRKTHKGEEFIEATGQSGVVDLDVKKNVQLEEKQLILSQTNDSGQDLQSPGISPITTTFISSNRRLSMDKASPTTSQNPTSSTPKPVVSSIARPTSPRPEKSTSASQSDLDSILSALRVKKSSPINIIKPTSVLDVDTKKASTGIDISSVWSSVKSPAIEHSAVLEVQEITQSPMEKSTTPPLSPPAPTTTSPPPIWQGRLNMPGEAAFQAVAYQVGGKKRATSREWESLLPPNLNIDGRIPINRVNDYLMQMGNSASKELAAIVLKPQNQQGSDMDGFKHLFKYFHEKERYGVINIPYSVVRDTYIVPMSPDDTLPEYFDYFEDFHIPEADRRNDVFVGILILNKLQSPHIAPPNRVQGTKSVQVSKSLFIPKEQQRREISRKPDIQSQPNLQTQPNLQPQSQLQSQSQPNLLAPTQSQLDTGLPPNIDFNLLQSVLGVPPEMFNILQQQQQQQHPMLVQPPPSTIVTSAPRAPIGMMHPDRQMQLQMRMQEDSHTRGPDDRNRGGLPHSFGAHGYGDQRGQDGGAPQNRW